MTNDYRSLDCPAVRRPTPNGYSPFRCLVLWTPSLLPLLFRTWPTPAEPVSLPEALAAVFERTQGYLYRLQQWDDDAWDAVTSFPITRDDIAIATVRAIRQLDFSFFHLRFDRLTGRERDFLFAMLRRWRHPRASGDIAEQNGRQSNAICPLRSKLIDKGMIYSPSHGENIFTVPLFDGFLKRQLAIS
jgi:hypothetical protein